MCVIFLADEKRPTPEMVRAAYFANNSGAGIAWRDEVTGLVKWVKGLELSGIQELIKQVPLPFVAHFRIPSAGGSSKQLCHPFPMSEDVELSLEGETEGSVLFHNGHWSDWRKAAFNIAVMNNLRVPNGLQWSDSRVMAWLAYRHGQGILEFIDEKVVVFGPGTGNKGIGIFGGPWSEEEGVLCSNLIWKSKYSSPYVKTFNKADEDEGDEYGVNKHYHTTAPASMAGKDVEKKKDCTDLAVISKNDAKRETSGGGSSVVPFRCPAGINLELAQEYLQKKLISKKQFKKIRRRLQKEGQGNGEKNLHLRTEPETTAPLM